MTPEEQNRLYDEIESHLKSFHLPSMHITALSGLLLADVFMPAIRQAERDALERAEKAVVSVANDIETDIPEGEYLAYKQAIKNALRAIRALAAE